MALWEKVCDAPDAVGRLRQLVLDLAVRGNLVQQNAREEPAALLLKQIAVVKAQSIGRHAGSDAVKSRLRQQEIPPGWARTTLGEIITLLSGQHLTPTEYSTDAFRGIPYVTGPSDFGQTELQISRYALIEKAVATKGQLLLTVKGSGVGKAILCNLPRVAISRQLMSLEPITWHIGFLQIITHSLAVMLQAEARSLIPGISRDDVTGFGLLLPPLAEQHRIVAKVDELMALCDRLEAAQVEREATRDRLAVASLTRLNTPNPETFPADARFALASLPALTTRSDQIKQLRQSILNLAVLGKLVSKWDGDTSVNVPGRQDEESGGGLPNGWRLVQLRHLLLEDTKNGYSRRPDEAPEGVPILRISAGTIRRDGLVAEEEHKLISGIDARARREYGLVAGDLLACRFNGNKAFVGRFTLFEDYLGLQPIYPDKLIRIRLHPDRAIPAFIRIAGESTLVRLEIEAFCATTVGNWGISASKLKEVRFPVPPIAEQRRIVAKVTALTTLCDQLEASLTSGSTTRVRLLEATLHDALLPAEETLLEAAQ